MLNIASELGMLESGQDSGFLEALAAQLLSATLGGVRPSASVGSKVVSQSGKNSTQGGSQKIDPNHLELVTVNADAHSISRHGGNVTDNQLMYRALTGVAPDGHVKISNGKTLVPPMSSAFYSDHLLVKADQFVRSGGALQSAIAQNPGKSIVTVKPVDVGDLGVDLGRGFERIGSGKLNSGLQGAPKFVEGLRSVQATYKLNPVTKSWETITIFPSR